MHFAQLNIGQSRGTWEDLCTTDFFGHLDRSNAIAKLMLGFVWRLKFVWQPIRAKIYAPKPRPFERPNGPAFVMWWIAEGHLPARVEAKACFEQFIARSSREHVLRWSGVSVAKLWQEKRCA